ncbi:MAG: winged helix-turn-helix transcriptional regulator [Bacteroidales bacterium]|nr:winged helix-turn-helix transcriptional regulator [Bacteroidales bacterium]
MKNREMHIQHIGVEIDTVNDTVNDTVFHLIKQNNKITASEISEQLKISLSTAKRRLKKLKDSKRIERIGSDKTGHWRII